MNVAVLLRICAKCIDGQDQLNKRRLQDILRDAARREVIEETGIEIEIIGLSRSTHIQAT